MSLRPLAHTHSSHTQIAAVTELLFCDSADCGSRPPFITSTLPGCIADNPSGKDRRNGEVERHSKKAGREESGIEK